MDRTNISTELDGALAGRNAGSKGFWECARSGNGNMRTDLMDEDGRDYEELEGLGEAIEDMDYDESVAEDRGDRSVFKPFRELRPGEQPPYAPKPGKAWMRRRIRTNNRSPGGNRQTRVRWVQVSPEKYEQLASSGCIKTSPANGVLGFLPAELQTPGALAGGVALGFIVATAIGRSRR